MDLPRCGYSGIGWYLGSAEISSETQMSEVTAPKGQISKCVLADGTEVWLNAGSTLKYDAALKGNLRSEERRVGKEC